MFIGKSNGIPDNQALFYPACGGGITVGVFGTDWPATIDWGAFAFEDRHFIDKNVLTASREGRDLFGNRVKPNPPCERVVGANVNSLVLGMLPSLTLDFVNKFNGKSCKIHMDSVLVVENLPVPVHVSEKRLEAKHRGKSTHSLWMDLDLPNHYLRRDLSLEEWTNSLPQPFRDHPRHGKGLIIVSPLLFSGSVGLPVKASTTSYILRFDGSCQGNPGPAAGAYCLRIGSRADGDAKGCSADAVGRTPEDVAG